MTLCFRAKGEPKQNIIPDWLSVEISFEAKQPRCYSISVVPEIAEVALVLGTLEIDGSAKQWMGYLESLGFSDVVQVPCLQLFGPRADRDR